MLGLFVCCCSRVGRRAIGRASSLGGEPFFFVCAPWWADCRASGEANGFFPLANPSGGRRDKNMAEVAGPCVPTPAQGAGCAQPRTQRGSKPKGARCNLLRSLYMVRQTTAFVVRTPLAVTTTCTYKRRKAAERTPHQHVVAECPHSPRDSSHKWMITSIFHKPASLKRLYPKGWRRWTQVVACLSKLWRVGRYAARSTDKVAPYGLPWQAPATSPRNRLAGASC